MSENNIIIIFDSADRQNINDNVTDYQVHLSKPIQCSSIELKEVILPWTMYNISSAQSNHQMTFFEAGQSDATITIPDGNYSMASLCTEIKTQMDNASPSGQTFTVTYNASTMKVSIVASTTAFIIYGSDSTSKTTGFEQEIGFTLATSSNTTNTSENVPKLLSPKYLLLNIDYVQDNVSTLDANKNASFLISTNINANSEQAGNIVHITQMNNFNQTIYGDHKLQKLRISLRDESNNLVDLNGCDWSIVLDFRSY